MRTFRLALACLIATIPPAFAGSIYSSPPCDLYLSFCKGLYPKGIDACQRSYDMALRTGGHWSNVDPRTHQARGQVYYCLP